MILWSEKTWRQVADRSALADSRTARDSSV